MSEAKEADVHYESAILAGMHEAARDLRDLDLISERTMAEFDELCLTPIKTMTPESIRELRQRERASHAVFALYLNVTPG